MTYRRVGGDETRTRYASAPIVRVESRTDSSMCVQIAFWSGEGPAGSSKRYTVVSFLDVMEFGWVEFDFGGPKENRFDFEFALIEIVDSERINGILLRDRDTDQGSATWSVAGLHHFRLGFDDHGTYDIVALSVELAIGESSNDVLPPL